MDELQMLRAIGDRTVPSRARTESARGVLLAAIAAEGRPRRWLASLLRLRRSQATAFAMAAALVVVAIGIANLDDRGRPPAQTDEARRLAALAVASLPPGRSFPPALADNRLTPAAGDRAEAVQVFAVCAWTNEWRDAAIVNDPSRLSAANHALATVRSWPIFQESTSDTTRRWIDRILAATTREDVSAVSREVEDGCAS